MNFYIKLKLLSHKLICWALRYEYFHFVIRDGLFILFILLFFILIIYNKGVEIIGIDYCSSLSQTTAEVDNLNNISEITNNDPIISLRADNNRSIINEQNTENVLHNEDSERDDNERNMEVGETESSKGFWTTLSGASHLYKNVYNTGRRRFQWYIREQFKDKYSTYKEFKENWNPDVSLRSKLREGIKNDIKQVNKNIEQKIENIQYQKRIIVYAYGGRRRRREREKNR